MMEAGRVVAVLIVLALARVLILLAVAHLERLTMDRARHLLARLAVLVALTVANLPLICGNRWQRSKDQHIKPI